MAKFVKLGLNSKVVKKHLVEDSIATTEQAGIDFLNKTHDYYPFWKQVLNNETRKNNPSKGWTYDEDREAFIPPKIHSSWTLNEDTCLWEAPVAYPDDGKRYEWNETTKSWDEIV